MINATLTNLSDLLWRWQRGIARACRWRHDGAVIAGGKRGLSPVILLVRNLILAGLLLWASPAWATFGNVGSFCTANDNTSSNPWIFTTSAQLTAGNLGVIVLTTDNRTTTDGNTSDHTTITDAAGNTWTKAREFTNGEGGAASGVTVSIWYSKASTNLANGGNVTANFSGSITAKAVTCWQYTMGAGNGIAVAGGNDRADDLTDAGSITVGSLASMEYLFLRGTGAESITTTYTASTNYTAFTHTSSTYNSGSNSTSMGARGEYRIFTGTTDSTNPTASGSRDHASTMVALRETLPLNNFLVEAAAGGSIGTQGAPYPFNIKITARDSGNNTMTSFTGTVTITSTGTLGTGGGTTASFTAGVLASHSVMISNTGSFTITATNTAGAQAGTSNAFTVNALNNFLVEAAAGGNIGTQTGWTAFNIKITARDSGNNPFTSFTGTVNITSTGTLDTGGGTTASFTAGVLASHSVTISNAGSFTITATNTAGAQAGTSNAFTVNDPPPPPPGPTPLSGYNYRQLIDITDALVSSGPHTNFPLLFCATLANLKTTGNGGKVTSSSGYDIVFTASDGTLLAHEVETYVNTTGQLIAWVRLPSLAATSQIYIYYGNPAVTTFQGNVTSNGVTGVWDNTFVAVWHLKEQTTDATPQMKDSKNANHATAKNTSGSNPIPQQVPGQIGGSLSFESANNNTADTTGNTPAISGVSSLTVTAWVKPFYGTSAQQHMRIFKKRDTSGETNIFQFGHGNTGTDLRVTMSSQTPDAVTAGGLTSAGTWGYWSMVFDGTQSVQTDRLKIYFNGVQRSVTIANGNIPATIPNSSGPLQMGEHNFYKGGIDELRFSTAIRSDGWLLTEYNNQSACSGFFAISAPESLIGDFNAYDISTAPATARTGVIKTKIANTTTFDIDIVRLNAARTAVDTAFTGTVRVELLDTSNDSVGFNAYGCRSTWTTVIQTLSPDPVFISGDNGRHRVSFTVANSYPNVRLRITYPVGAPTATGCSTDNFAIRPNSFVSYSVTDGDATTAGTARTPNNVGLPGGIIHKAGRPLTVQATAANAAGATTTNYTGTPSVILTTCAPAGNACTATFGTFTLGTNFAAGVLASNLASYSEVGSFNLQLVDSAFASVDATDGSTTTERNITSGTVTVGRFVPDHFAAAPNTPVFGNPCGGGFTYIGQVFNYTTAPVFTLTAQNFTNGTTTLYTGALWQITNTSLTGKSYNAAAGTLDTSGVTGTDPVIVAGGGGTGTLTFSSGTGLKFTRAPSAPDGPFNAEISLAINVIDADGVTASNPVSFGAATSGNGIAFSGGKPMRFGRLVIRNANGSQLLPLPVRVEAQYWSGSAFITNTLDNCTSIASGNVTLGYLPASPNLVACNTAISGGGALSMGRRTLQLALPGSAKSGSVDLTVNLGASASGNTCATVGGSGPSTTTANLPHLQGNWTGVNFDQNPSARATFGAAKGAEEVIFVRENF